MLSPGGWPDVPCITCGRRVPGLPLGARCHDCAAEHQRRAKRLSRWIAIAATAAAATYVMLRTPDDPAARYYGALAVVVTYLLVRRIAQRIAMEVMP